MGDRAKILLVEDDRFLNEINRRALESAGHEVMTASTLAAARKWLTKIRPDAIVLDVTLPDGNGVAFCQEIRPVTLAPILFLTSSHGHEDELAALRAGGNDYLRKPFDLEVLIARVDSFVCRDRMAKRVFPGRPIVIGNLTLEVVAGRALADGKDLLLTQKEFSILLALVQQDGENITPEDLYQTIWKRPLGDDARALWAHISRLNKKLRAGIGPDGPSIHTERGHGYRFSAGQ
jgi:DNA-binding response OmpR family regulator